MLSLTVNASSIPPEIVLTVPPPTGKGQFQFRFPTAAGVSYTLQYSTDLQTWSPFLTFSGAGGTQSIMVPLPAGQRFYRLKFEP